MAKKPIDDDDDDDLSDFDFTEDSDEEFEGFDDDDDDFFDDEDDDELSENDNQISTENDAAQKKGRSVETKENLKESSEEDLTEENEAAQVTSTPSIAETGPIAPDQIPVTLTVEIGQIEIPVHQLLKLEPGNMLELHTHPAHVVNLTINSKTVGKGELIRIGDILGVRLLQLGVGQE